MVPVVPLGEAGTEVAPDVGVLVETGVGCVVIERVVGPRADCETPLEGVGVGVRDVREGA